MAVEPIRRCGYRKVGGYYIVGRGVPFGCDRLPYQLKPCPVCGLEVKFSRGIQWLDWKQFAGEHIPCKDDAVCYVCHPKPERYGLMWVGNEYTPETFLAEAKELGVSKRLPAPPRGFKPGSFVLLSMKDAMGTQPDPDNIGKVIGIPGVFAAFVATAIEKLIWQHDATPAELEKLNKAGITPVVIPDGDVDHDPTSGNDFDDEQFAERKLEDLKAKFRKMRSNG